MSDFGQKLIDEIRRVAAEHPWKIYDEGKCAYVLNGEPACLVGHGLWNLGVIDSTAEAERFNDDSIDDALDRLDLTLDPVEVAWLENVQAAQDEQNSWASSVRIADEIVLG